MKIIILIKQEYDLILAGERATDGDTGQVGPGIASFLDLPLATYVSRIDEISSEEITVERLLEEGYEVLRLPLPALVTVVKEISSPRLPTLRGKKTAKAKAVPKWSAAELGLDERHIGLKGSPTRVVRIESPKVTRNSTIMKALDEESLESAVEELARFITSRTTGGEVFKRGG